MMSVAEQFPTAEIHRVGGASGRNFCAHTPGKSSVHTPQVREQFNSLWTNLNVLISGPCKTLKFMNAQNAIHE